MLPVDLESWEAWQATPELAPVRPKESYMTETNQESAASELPARPRVHQLAKHIGITSRELLAELAQRGHELRSASSVVLPDIVVAVLEAHTTQPPGRTPLEQIPPRDPKHSPRRSWNRSRSQPPREVGVVVLLRVPQVRPLR